MDNTYPKEYTNNDKGIVITQLRVIFYAIKEVVLTYIA